MAYPDFLCIGARKSGTTWLHANLGKHPQIYLPPVKETHYFDHNRTWLVQRLFGRASYLRNARKHLWEVMIRTRGKGEEFRWAVRYCLFPRNDEWYASLFPELEDVVCGEVCPGYARLDRGVIRDLALRAPGLKIIYLLRNPIECAWSSAGAHFEKKLGTRGIDKASHGDVIRYLTKKHTVSHLAYAQNISNWMAYYPSEQLFLGYFDELRADPASFLGRILEFLGLKPRIPPDVARKHGTRTGRRSEVIPTKYHRILADLHYEGLQQLYKMFPNRYTREWLAEASAVLGARDPWRNPVVS